MTLLFNIYMVFVMKLIKVKFSKKERGKWIIM